MTSTVTLLHLRCYAGVILRPSGDKPSGDFRSKNRLKASSKYGTNIRKVTRQHCSETCIVPCHPISRFSFFVWLQDLIARQGSGFIPPQFLQMMFFFVLHFLYHCTTHLLGIQEGADG